MKIGITGSIASGKTTSSRIISRNRGPLFSADKIVKKLYKDKNFRKTVAKKLKFKLNQKFKNELLKTILESKDNLKKLEKLLHPLVRKEMHLFSKKYKNKKILFFEIPLLIENQMSKLFDKVLFIRLSKNMRLKRYMSNKGNKKLFYLLDTKQIKDVKKMQFCDHVIVNNSSLYVLKKKLLNIIRRYV